MRFAYGWSVSAFSVAISEDSTQRAEEFAVVWRLLGVVALAGELAFCSALSAVRARRKLFFSRPRRELLYTM